MTNTNCLRSISCPNIECESEGPFNIYVNILARVTDDGVEEYIGDTQWNLESSITCPKCQTFGTVAAFTEPHFITRDNYIKLNNRYMGDKKKQEKNHHNYYKQFVTPKLIKLVEQTFGKEKLQKALAKDTHLNSISLQQWDNLTLTSPKQQRHTNPIINTRLPIDWAKLKIAKETKTPAALTCIVKAAAKELCREKKDND